MSIEVDENLLGIWYVSWCGADWLAGACKTPAGPEGHYRFRHYKDDRAFDSKDEKSWFDLKPKEGLLPSNQELIDACSEMATLISQVQGGKRWELIRGTSTLVQFTEQFKALPFVYTKRPDSKDCRISMREHGTDITVTVIHKETGKRACATGGAARKQDVKNEAIRKLAEILYGYTPQ